uniref:Uncharacterized protein n=1 Tax=Melanopsichium pennsylvanicum 4 TaxID=1398559 RepID=A0A077R3V9_9BASI|nr:uncharacterized protein BN887_06115 [Melanopsichium pennsylvanicum 4]
MPGPDPRSFQRKWMTSGYESSSHSLCNMIGRAVAHLQAQESVHPVQEQEPGLQVQAPLGPAEVLEQLQAMVYDAGLELDFVRIQMDE